jgi:hypothetical protein
LVTRSLRRFSVVVCHRRFGKTVLAVNTLIDSALKAEWSDARYQYIAPLRNQAKDIAWMYLKRYATVVPGVTVNESELRVDFPHNGARVTIYGADNPDSLRGLYYDGVVLDEYAQMDPAVWTQVIRPAIDDHNGWALFIGTPQGKNKFWELYDGAVNGFMQMDDEGKPTGVRSKSPDWFGMMFRASETDVFTAEQLAAAKADMNNDDLYEQEYECSFQAALTGAYYGKLMAAAEKEGRIGEVPWLPALSVHTSWDLGVHDATAIWFWQKVGERVRVIDYMEGAGAGLGFYVKALREKPYVYGQHIMPHDVDVQELGSGQTRVETLRSLGLYPRILPRMNLEDGIQAVRNLIPLCWFDAKKCSRGLEALRQYQREWDSKMQAWREKPRHDWSSHAADAARYGALGLPMVGGTDLKPIKYPKPAGGMSAWV